MKDLSKILKSNKIGKARKTYERKKIVVESVYEYLQKSHIIDVMSIKNAINEIYDASGSALDEMANPVKNIFMADKGIKYLDLKDIITKIIGKKQGYEIKIKRIDFGKNKPKYILYLDKNKCHKIIKKYLSEPKKILEFTFKEPDELRKKDILKERHYKKDDFSIITHPIKIRE